MFIILICIVLMIYNTLLLFGLITVSIKMDPRFEIKFRNGLYIEDVVNEIEQEWAPPFIFGLIPGSSVIVALVMTAFAICYGIFHIFYVYIYQKIKYIKL